ncbi:glycosyl hydrolase [Leifsonia sp. NPDC077715]|uniref:glycoside hydrolase family 26 protein n=1 Tax=Leifsonia sp. NPDC077715 TaxID=3155539 RepID=UPI00343D564A
MSTSSPRFWARSRTNARVTAVAALVLAACLVAVSWFVWSTPENPVRKVADSVIAATNPLAVQNAQLKKKLSTTSDTVASQAVRLKRQAAAAAVASAAHAKEMASAQQQLAAAQQEIARLKADGNDGSGGSLSGGSSASGGSAHPSTGGGKGNTQTAATITAPSRDSLLHPDKRYFGMYTEQAPFNWATFDATSKKIGVQPNVVGYFSGWDENFRSSAVTRAWQQGRLPLLTWESRPIGADNNTNVAPEYSLPKIIDGGFDAYLHQYAKDIIATGLPVAIRLDHEMNGTWYPWSELTGANKPINGNNVGDYVRMWRHVHDIFQQEGANNLVIWVWAPNIINNMRPASHATQEFLNGYYPGDDYVDWVGLSGYLRPPWRAGNDFTSSYTYDASLNQLRALTTKPIFLAEVGASETDGHKATWVKSFFDGFADPKNADIIGFSWFSLAITSYVGGERSTNDWRIDSRSDSLAAFSQGISRPDTGFALIPAD